MKVQSQKFNLNVFRFNSLWYSMLSNSFAPTEFAPASTNDQMLKISLSLTEQNNIVGIMKQDHTKDGYFSFFN